MADVEGQEKSEKATPKKLSDARDRGQVAKSMEVNSFVIFSTGFIILYISQDFISTKFYDLSAGIFKSLDSLEINSRLFQSYMIDWASFFFITLAPLFIGLIIVSLIASISQVGLKFSTQAITPKIDKFNIFSGIKRILFSSSSFVELGKSALKFIIIGGLIYLVLEGMILGSLELIEMTTGEIVNYMIDSSFSLIIKVALVFAVIAVTDFVFQKKKFMKDMMMTKQEVKEEYKQSEGDPLIKSRIRKLQISAARNRMMKQLPEADVVITNPTHYAVALKYDSVKNAAPKVIAKGTDHLAQRIKQVAAEHGIPLHEDRELARALYKVCDVGDVIPESLFKAVAQILAYVYQMRNYKKKRSIV